MSKAKQKKKTSFNKHNPWWLKHVLPVALGVMLVLFFALLYQVIVLRSAYNNLRAINSNPNTLAALIKNSIEGASRELAVNPLKNDDKLYIPEAKLVLAEPKDPEQTLLYQPIAELGAITVLINQKTVRDDTTAELVQATDVESLFDKVPTAQACSQQFVLQFKTISDNSLKFAFEKNLIDGRTVIVYTHKDCPKEAERGLAYLQTIESY
jgi:hypothetical protein